MLHNDKARNTARLTIALYLAVLATLLVYVLARAGRGVSIPLMLTVKPCRCWLLQCRSSAVTIGVISGWPLW